MGVGHRGLRVVLVLEYAVKVGCLARKPVPLVHAACHQSPLADSASPRGGLMGTGVDMSTTPLLPEVVPEIDAGPLRAYTVVVVR